MRRLAAILSACLWGMAALAAQAAGIAWERLPATEQRVLAPFEAQWSTLAPDTQDQLRLGAQRWLGMSADEQRQAAERKAFLEGMAASGGEAPAQRFLRNVPPEERDATRRMLRELSPAQRQSLRQRMQALAPEERQALRRQLIEASPEQRATLLQ